MGMLMVRCPKTGRTIPTRRYIESRLFGPCVFRQHLLSALSNEA
jgi:hypothetical protein